MQTADVILYDRLVSPDILNLCNRSAQLIYVGKQAGFHTRSQHDIHLLLNFFASRNHKVVRLKGGDPFIFGRGGEELSYLESRGVRVSVSPGITAAAGIAAELGIPLTQRGIAHSVQLVTGHARDGRPVQLGALQPHTTYVVYMGLSQLRDIVQQLMGGGLCASTPAVAVERGTTAQQRVVSAPLGELARAVSEGQLRSPALVFVGEVVRQCKVWGLALVKGRLVEQLDAAALRQLVDKVDGC